MSTTLPPAAELLGTIALTGAGERLGLVVDVYPRNPAEAPEWVWVRTGIVESDVSVVPLAGARAGHGSLVVAFTEDQVEQAPRHPTAANLTVAQEHALHEHYASPLGARLSAVPSGGTIPPGGVQDASTAARARVVETVETVKTVETEIAGDAGEPPTRPAPGGWVGTLLGKAVTALRRHAD